MKPLIAIFVALLLVTACRKEEPKPVADSAGHIREISLWQKKRAERLMAEDGWLSLVGLQWLNEGENALEIPHEGTKSPGKVVMRSGVVTLEPAVPMTIGGKPVTTPTVLL